MGRLSCGGVQTKLRKGLWSPEEDERLYNHIIRHGIGRWSSVPKLVGKYANAASMLECSITRIDRQFAIADLVCFVFACRAATLRQELPAAVDQLPPARPEARQLLAAGGGPHRRAPRDPREHNLRVAMRPCRHGGGGEGSKISGNGP
ncbi:hypothetical protein ABZP36_014439, partial [Zizania latifolia]